MVLKTRQKIIKVLSAADVLVAKARQVLQLKKRFQDIQLTQF